MKNSSKKDKVIKVENGKHHKIKFMKSYKKRQIREEVIICINIPFQT